jgi:hypothetical protein
MTTNPLFPPPVVRPRPWRIPAGLQARVWPARLDRMLAAGVDPDTSPALRRRARVLTSRRRRVKLADRLEGVVASVKRPRARRTSAIPVQSAEVVATGSLILQLAKRIRGGDQTRPAGVILVRRLLTDGSGPLFAAHEPGALWDAVAQAILALGHVRPQSS